MGNCCPQENIYSNECDVGQPFGHQSLVNNPIMVKITKYTLWLAPKSRTVKSLNLLGKKKKKLRNNKHKAYI